MHAIWTSHTSDGDWSRDIRSMLEAKVHIMLSGQLKRFLSVENEQKELGERMKSNAEIKHDRILLNRSILELHSSSFFASSFI